jgi:hypothetical protein
MTMFNIPSLPSVSYVSAPCGTGKTYAACQYIPKYFDIGNYLIACPTLRQMDETRITLEAAGVKVTCINRQTQEGSVTQAIIALLEQASSVGEALLISVQALFALKHFPSSENWIKFIDEVPQVDLFFAPEIPHSVDLLRHYIVVEPLNDKLLRVRFKDAKALRAFLEAPNDDGYKPFIPILREVVSPYKDVFVDARSWSRIGEERLIDISREGDGKKIYFLSMLNLRRLRPFALLGANITDSMVFSWSARFHGMT